MSKSEHNIQNIIKKRKYTEPWFTTSQPKMKEIVDWMQLCEINKENMNEIVQMYKFFGLSFIFSCKSFYSRLNKSDLVNYQSQLTQIIHFTKYLVQGDIPQQLSFLNVVNPGKATGGKDKKISQNEEKFIGYWRIIRQSFKQLKKIPLGSENFEDKIFQFFDLMGETAKLNFFEQYFTQIYSDQALKLVEENQNKLLAIEKEKQEAINKKDFKFEKMQIQQEGAGDKNKVIQPIKNKNEFLTPKNLQNVPMCCRKYFYKHQIIQNPQNLSLEYKNYNFPFTPELQHQLKKVICGFLNRNGGCIFIGIKEEKNTRKRIVIGDIYDQNKKQTIHKFFKTIAKDFYPEITLDLRYAVKFVPIKNQRDEFIMGSYLIKVVIKYGERDQVYSFRQKMEDFFYFRTQNQVLKRNGRDICIQLKKRVKNPLQIPKLIHPGDCPEPDLGISLFKSQNYIKNVQNKKKNQKEQPYFEKKKQFPQSNYKSFNQNFQMKNESPQYNKQDSSQKKYVQANPIRNFIIFGLTTKFKEYDQLYHKIDKNQFQYKTFNNNLDRLIIVGQMTKYYFQGKQFKSNIQYIKNKFQIPITVIMVAKEIQFRGPSADTQFRRAIEILKKKKYQFASNHQNIQFNSYQDAMMAGKDLALEDIKVFFKN